MQLRTAVLGLILAGALAGCDSKSDPCVPACEGRQCGVDSQCGESCGSCPSDELCDEETGRCLCVPDCADRFCGPDHCGGSCGACQAPLVCSPRARCEGEVGQGEACGRGAEHWTIVSCVEGLTCLDFVFEPDSALDPAVMPCSADSDCLAFYQPDWNPVCVGGDCVASLCAASCSEANGPDWCPEGFDPYYDHAREECLCVPVGAPGALPLGAACSLGPVNPGAGNCQAWGWCFSPILDAGPSCETDADCEALTPMPGVDCVGERCVFASCAAPCAVDCPAGWEDFQPTDYPCTCLARSQAEGEPCRFGEVNAEASDCQAGLDCIGMAPDPVNAPCPNGDADCIVFMDAQWNGLRGRRVRGVLLRQPLRGWRLPLRFLGPGHLGSLLLHSDLGGVRLPGGG